MISSFIMAIWAESWTRPHVVAAHHAGHAPYPAVDDIVVEGPVARPEKAAQEIVDRLMAEADHDVLRMVRDIDGVPRRFGKFSMAIFRIFFAVSRPVSG